MMNRPFISLDEINSYVERLAFYGIPLPYGIVVSGCFVKEVTAQTRLMAPSTLPNATAIIVHTVYGDLYACKDPREMYPYLRALRR